MDQKKAYTKPVVRVHGTVEDVTGYTGENDIFGGGFLSSHSKAQAKKHGPADFGS